MRRGDSHRTRLRGAGDWDFPFCPIRTSVQRRVSRWRASRGGVPELLERIGEETVE